MAGAAWQRCCLLFLCPSSHMRASQGTVWLLHILLVDFSETSPENSTLHRMQLLSYSSKGNCYFMLMCMFAAFIFVFLSPPT